MEIDLEIFSAAILLLPLIQEGLLSVTSKSMCTKYWLTTKSKLAQEKSVVRLTNHLNMTIAVDFDGKPQTKQWAYHIGKKSRLRQVCTSV